MGEYSFPGVPVVQSTAEIFEEVQNWPDFGVHRVIYNCVDGDEKDQLSFCCRLSEAIGNVVLIIEEVDQYATPHDIPADLRRLLKVGRHFNVGMVFVSRRPAEINRLITSQTREFILFRLIEPADLRYLSSVVGPVADDVSSLPDLHFIAWKHGSIERGKVAIPGMVV